MLTLFLKRSFCCTKKTPWFYKFWEITERITNSVFLFSYIFSLTRMTQEDVSQRKVQKFGHSRETSSGAGITTLALKFNHRSFLFSYCLNVPEASFSSVKDSDLWKEFCKFKALCTATPLPCDVFHLPQPAAAEDPFGTEWIRFYMQNEQTTTTKKYNQL